MAWSGGSGLAWWERPAGGAEQAEELHRDARAHSAGCCQREQAVCACASPGTLLSSPPQAAAAESGHRDLYKEEDLVWIAI